MRARADKNTCEKCYKLVWTQQRTLCKDRCTAGAFQKDKKNYVFFKEPIFDHIVRTLFIDK